MKTRRDGAFNEAMLYLAGVKGIHTSKDRMVSDIIHTYNPLDLKGDPRWSIPSLLPLQIGAEVAYAQWKLLYASLGRQCNKPRLGHVILARDYFYEL